MENTPPKSWREWLADHVLCASLRVVRAWYWLTGRMRRDGD